MCAAETAGRVRTQFHAVRSFHAARPTDITRYYRDGIEPLTRSRWHELVDECFLSQIDSAPVADAVVRARDVQFDIVAESGVHFCCDRRLLEERDGYTLLFGSLSLMAVAIRIDKEFATSFKEALRRRGEPTVFVCDVPTAIIADDVLANLIGALRAACGAPLFDFHFAIPCALPANAVIGHYRPKRVLDLVYRQHIGGAEQPPVG